MANGSLLGFVLTMRGGKRLSAPPRGKQQQACDMCPSPRGKDDRFTLPGQRRRPGIRLASSESQLAAGFIAALSAAPPAISTSFLGIHL